MPQAAPRSRALAWLRAVSLLGFAGCGAESDTIKAPQPTPQAIAPAPAKPTPIDDDTREIPVPDEDAPVELVAVVGRCEYRFGTHLAMGGNLLAVSAPYAGALGEIFVYRRGASGWKQEATLPAQGSAEYEAFDWSLAASDEHVALAAPWLPEKGFPRGLIVVSARKAGRWTRVAEITTTDKTTIGRSIALQGKILISGGSEVEGDEASPGFVAVYEERGGKWAQVQRLTPPRPDASFGATLAFAGQTLVVGAPGAFGRDKPGRILLFERTKTGWQSQQEIVGPSPDFGSRLAGRADHFAAASQAEPDLRVFVRSGARWIPKRSLEVEKGVTVGPLTFPTTRELLMGESENQFVDMFQPDSSAEPYDALMLDSQEDREAGDIDFREFGGSIASESDHLAVGGPASDERAGAVYMFKRTKSGWVLSQTLQPACAQNPTAD